MMRISRMKPFLKLRSFHSSAHMNKRVVELVPALGESITEGSISKWMKSVGDSVNVDDVVVVVETDKVTVDIKSTLSGVLSKKLATDLVVVGKELYEIETDSTQSIEKSEAPTTVTSVPPTKKEEPHANKDTSAGNHGTRVPSIKFIGKRSKESHHAKDNSGSEKAPAKQSPTVAVTKGPTKPQTGVNFTELRGGAWYGRPQYTAKEIEAILTGGATIMY